MFEIGSTLREARVRQSLDFIECEQATKIRAKYLRALEDEQFEVLPSQTYVKGFLRSYAEYLGLDGQIYVDEYNSRYVTGDEEAALRPRRSAARTRQHRRVERNVIVIALVAIAVVTALIIAAWKFGGGSGQNVVGVKQGPAKPRVHHPLRPHRVVRLIRAVGGDSGLQIRLTSPSGRPHYQGTLQKGQVQPLPAGRLWLAISSPEHIQIKLAGHWRRVGGLRPCNLVITRRNTFAGSC